MFRSHNGHSSVRAFKTASWCSLAASVGWVERSETHQGHSWGEATGGFRRAQPTLRHYESLPDVLHIKIPQIRWALALFGRHEEPIGAAHIAFIADLDVVVVLGADRLDPDRIADAVVVLGDGPRTGQRIVDGGNLVVEHVGLVLVLVEPLVDDGLAVRVKLNAA